MVSIYQHFERVARAIICRPQFGILAAGLTLQRQSLNHRSAIEAKGVCKNWFRASLPAVLASSQEAN